MYANEDPSCVKLPSIEELFPAHLLHLPKQVTDRPPHHALHILKTPERTRSIKTDPDTASQIPLPSPMHPRSPQSSNVAPLRESTYSSYSRGHTSHSPSTSPIVHPEPLSRLSDGYYPASTPFSSTYLRRQATREQEKKHACDVCGRAFNRPSSLAIHINTHTGAQPYVCPFPGCGRKFNVNSNMRRHFRNHTSSSRQLATSPYTYPLTTVPRVLHTTSSTIMAEPKRDALPGLRPRAWTVTGEASSQYTDSEDDEDLFYNRGPRSSVFDRTFDAQVKETTELVERLRLRSRSSPGLRPARIINRSMCPPSSPASACNVPGCHHPRRG